MTYHYVWLGWASALLVPWVALVSDQSPTSAGDVARQSATAGKPDGTAAFNDEAAV